MSFLSQGRKSASPRWSDALQKKTAFVVDIYRMTGNPEVISSPVGLVPTNALVSRDLANFPDE